MAPALFKICAGGSLVMHEMWDTHMTLKSIVKMRMLGKDSVVWAQWYTKDGRVIVVETYQMVKTPTLCRRQQRRCRSMSRRTL